jgi:NarL family two-component system response regulator LiaR
VKRILLYAAGGGLLIAFLKYLEYQHFIRAHPTEVFGGLVAVIFTIVGVWAGLRLVKPKEITREVTREVIVERVVTIDRSAPFARDDDKLRELTITPRELEILGLIAEGLSNREIAERLFVSEATVKTHSSRVFEKLDVSRRTQAVQRAKELRLIP